MKPCVMICLLTLFSQALQAASSTPVGDWQILDDVTGEPKAIVKVWETKAHTLSARIVKRLSTTVPLVGTTLFENLKGVPSNAKQWSGGTLIDPRYGKRYKCYLQLKDDGHTLNVRSYLGFAMLGHQQTWLRFG